MRKFKYSDTWFILVPRNEEWLRDWLKSEHNNGFEFFEPKRKYLDVFPGRTDYSALIQIINLGLDEGRIKAKELSSLINEAVYLVEINDCSNEGITYFENEKEIKREIVSNVFDFAEEILGEPIWSAPVGEEEDLSRGVVVVENSLLIEIEKELLPFLEQNPEILLTQSGNNTILYNSENKDVTLLASVVSALVKQQEAYSLYFDPDKEKFKFRCHLKIRGNTSAAYSYPELDRQSEGWIPVVDNIFGETHPEKIAEKLGVPFEILFANR
jgi:hypothetical protein